MFPLGTHRPSSRLVSHILSMQIISCKSFRVVPADCTTWTRVGVHNIILFRHFVESSRNLISSFFLVSSIRFGLEQVGALDRTGQRQHIHQIIIKEMSYVNRNIYRTTQKVKRFSYSKLSDRFSFIVVIFFSRGMRSRLFSFSPPFFSLLLSGCRRKRIDKNEKKNRTNSSHGVGPLAIYLPMGSHFSKSSKRPSCVSRALFFSSVRVIVEK